MATRDIAVKTLILSVAAVLSIELAARALILEGFFHPLVLLAGARLLQVVLIILIVRFSGKGIDPIGLAGFQLFSGLKKGLIWSTGFAVVAVLGFLVLFFAGINGLALVQTRLPATHSDVILFFLVGGVIGPVAEEVFFRGVLYTFLRRWGVALAVVLSTLVFVLPHLVGPGIPITQVVGGIVFAVAYEVEGSLMVPITIHVLGNVAIFAISIFA